MDKEPRPFDCIVERPFVWVREGKLGNVEICRALEALLEPPSGLVRAPVETAELAPKEVAAIPPKELGRFAFAPARSRRPCKERDGPRAAELGPRPER